MCTITQQWYETCGILLAAMYVSVFQMKTTDTEQISDTINLVDEYRLRTDDAVV